MNKEALKLALAALTIARGQLKSWGLGDEAITAIKEALAQQEHDDSDINQVNDGNAQVSYPTIYFNTTPPQPEQEPVKYEFQVPDGTWHPFLDKTHYENTVEDGSWPIRALYTTPPQRKPLTDEQVQKILEDTGYAGTGDEVDFICGLRHGEAAHGIKE